MPNMTPAAPAKADPGLSLEEMKTFVRNHFEDFVNRKKSEVANKKGDSRISMEDYAIAMADELETHAHPKQRFSVGY